VALSDGSGREDPALSELSKTMGFHYLPGTEKLGFAKGYNAGIEYFAGLENVEYIVLSANDIIVKNNIIEGFLNAFPRYPDTGCLIPYLSKSDYFIQQERYLFRNRVIPIMTLNCNFFLKKDLLAIGSVPEHLSGYFNDIVMSSRIFGIGKKIVLCRGLTADHLVSRTVAISSSANYERDKGIFMSTHAELSEKGDFSIIAEKFSKSRFEIFFSKASRLFNSRRYRRFWQRSYKLCFDIELFIYRNFASLLPRNLKSKLKSSNKI
jgi:hypothetical protein